MSKKIIVDKDILFDLYINKNMTVNEVAEKLNVGYRVITRRLSEFNIKKDKSKIIENSQRKLLDNYPDGFSSQSIIEKRKKTNLEKYGFESASKSNIIKEKMKNTNIERYGNACSLQNESVMQKSKNTMLKKYGVDHPMHSDEIKTKMKDTLLEKYGVENISYLDEINAKKRKKMYDFYGNINSDLITSVSKSRESFRKFIIDNNYDNTKEISLALNCTLTPVEHLLNKYDSWDLMKHYRSNAQNEISDFLLSIGVYNESRRDLISPYEIDMFCPDFNIGIEFNGNYWHSSVEKSKTYHLTKTKMAENIGIRLIHIYEYEWNNPIKKEILKSFLKITFGKVENKIYARECIIKKIDNKTASLFNDINHLQGHKNAQVTYGLYYKDELVQLMSFSYKSNKGWWEIERGCPGSNNIVVGGVSKLFKHFIKEYNPNTVFSYCDNNKFNGIGYEKLGMEYIGDTGPDMKWVLNGIVYNRNPKKHKYFKDNKALQIYGAGSKKYLWKNHISDAN